MTIHGLCRKCGRIMTYVEPGLDPRYHPTCGPNYDATRIFTDPPGPKPFDLQMKMDLTEVIQWAWRNDTRSQQRMIGPSELGEPCRRKLAYRIAGMPAVNDRVDPWPALVGTAVHRWIEQAVIEFERKHGTNRWLTETEVYPDDMVVGHCDLFDLDAGAVWDIKTMNSDKLREFSEGGQVPEGYRVQIHTYGLGMQRAGHEVGSVGLVVLPRSGWLSNMFVWSEPYQPEVAQEALARMYAIAEEVLELGVDEHPEQVNVVEATPSRMCSFCDYYTPEPVDGIGCPGK